eukprot:4502690-Pyramimonas_sp.AAC.1
MLAVSSPPQARVKRSFELVRCLRSLPPFRGTRMVTRSCGTTSNTGSTRTSRDASVPSWPRAPPRRAPSCRTASA